MLNNVESGDNVICLLLGIQEADDSNALKALVMVCLPWSLTLSVHCGPKVRSRTGILTANFKTMKYLRSVTHPSWLLAIE